MTAWRGDGRRGISVHPYQKLGRDAFEPKRSILGPFGRLVDAVFDERGR